MSRRRISSGRRRWWSSALQERNKVFVIESIDRKMDFEDIARLTPILQRAATEIEAIVILYELYINYYIEQTIDEDKAEEIYLYFKEDAESDSVDEAIRELGSDFTEEEVRLVRIKFICEQGN